MTHLACIYTCGHFGQIHSSLFHLSCYLPPLLSPLAVFISFFYPAESSLINILHLPNELCQLRLSARLADVCLEHIMCLQYMWGVIKCIWNLRFIFPSVLHVLLLIHDSDSACLFWWMRTFYNCCSSREHAEEQEQLISFCGDAHASLIGRNLFWNIIVRCWCTADFCAAFLSSWSYQVKPVITRCLTTKPIC